ncbi:hypothetical protein WR25_23043 [Diploscapter pachys]|uniref:Uncharacterized protein n=1 Tax=Diploscapter pachys TaxID=2018661 RepID=A0A2A2JD07_9BILA|nr:hypothetical protein WR25_23043 [Diploscapter pachys]
MTRPKFSCPGPPPQLEMPSNRSARSLSEFQVHSTSIYNDFDEEENRLNKSYNGAMKIPEQVETEAEVVKEESTPEAETDTATQLDELQKSLIQKGEQNDENR